jgi:hypothetical protein
LISALQQPDQIGIGALVEHQEPGVHAVADAFEREVDGVGMAAKPSLALEQRDLRFAREGMRNGKSGNARTDDCHTPHFYSSTQKCKGAPRLAVPLEIKTAARRP